MEFFESVQQATDHAKRIYACMGELMYYVEGDERGMLIDTGLGVGDLRDIVDQISTKPYSVLLTHGHIDHAMGSPLFLDKDIYMNHADIELARSMSNVEERKMQFDGAFPGQVRDEDYVIYKEPSYIDVNQGDSFDLGGLHLDIFQLPGHTAGSICVLFREERILLTGDAANDFTFMFSPGALSIKEYRDNLTKTMADTEGLYDRVLLSHASGETSVNILEGVRGVCDDIMSGNVDDVPFNFQGMDATIAKALDPVTMKRVDGGVGNIVYNKAAV